VALEDTTKELREAYFELVQSRPAYERAAAMYEGTIEEVYSSHKVKLLLAKFGLNAIESFNFAHIPVDAVANKLRLNSVTADDQGNEEGDIKVNKEVNSVIEDLFDYNEFQEELPLLFRNVGKYGDYYMMVWPVIGNEDDDPSISRAFDKNLLINAVDDTVTGQVNQEGDPVVEDNHVEVPAGNRAVVAVDMMMLDPLTTRVFYDPENPRRKMFAIRSWQEGDKQDMIVRVNLYYPDRIERWYHKGKPSNRKHSKEKWTPYDADGKEAVLSNPFGEVPFFHFRTERTYGRPDHINAYGPQLAINKLVVSHLATVDYQSFPQRYALTDPKADESGFQGADSDPFSPEDGLGDPEADDNEGQLEADPGAVWLLQGIKNVGQFQPSDPDAYLKPFDRYVKALAQATDTPFHYFDRTGERPPSGENIRQVNEVLLSKAEARQTSYGSELRKSVTFALNMLGHDVERVNVEWDPLENVTSLVEWQAIQAKQDAGVPRDVTLVEAGYRANLVQEWKRQEEAQAEKERQQALEDEQMKIDAAKEAKIAITQENQKAKDVSTSKSSSSASASKPQQTPKSTAPKK
jgi:hypothetical protein